MSKELNLRQQRFLEGYLRNGNASQAVRNAGYQTKYPDKYASQLLAKPQIKAELEETREKINTKTQLTFEYKLKTLAEGIDQYTASGDYDKAGRLIEIANKMQGHNAPDKNVSTTEVDWARVKELTEEGMRLLERKISG